MVDRRFKLLQTLRVRFLLALTLVGVLPLVLVGLGVATMDHRALGEQSARELTGLARGLAGQLDGYLTGLWSASRGIAALPEIVNMDAVRQGAVLQELFHHFHEFARLSTFDLAGQRLASSHPGGAPSIAVRDSFQTAVRHGHQAWEVAHALSTGRVSLLIHTPIRDADRRVVGVVGAVVDLGNLSAVVGKVPLGGGGRAFVLDSTGRVLLHPDRAAVQARPDFSWLGVPTGGRPTGTGTVRYKSDGEVYVAGYAKVTSVGWTVLVELAESEVLAPAEQSWRLALAGMAAGALLALATAIFLARALTHPVRVLAAAARAFGAGDWAAPLPVITPNAGELSTLVDAFAAMREALAEREVALNTRAHRQAVIADLGQRALAGIHLSTLMNEAVARVGLTLNVEYCRVLELLPDGNTLLWRAGAGWMDGDVAHATVGGGANSQAGSTLLVNEPVLVEDLHTETRFGESELLHNHSIASALSVIIPSRSRPFGVLDAHTTRRRLFMQDDVDFLQAIANVLATAIDRKRAEAELVGRRQEAEVMAELDRTITASLDLATILPGVVAGAKKLCGSDIASIALQAVGSEVLVIRHWTGARYQSYESVHIQPGKGIGGRALATGVPWRTDHYAEDPRLSKDYMEVIRAEQIVSAMAVPIRIGARVEGVIYLANRTPRPFTDRDEDILRRLADHAANAIHNARLYAEVCSGRERLQTLSHQLLQAQESERRTIARELHDEIGQALTAVKMNLQGVQRLPAASTVVPYLEENIQLVECILQQVRTLSLELRPSLLDDLGLVAALRWYADRQAQRAGFSAQVEADPIEMGLPPDLETACFRIAQEALTNVVRHARARRVWVGVRQTATKVRLDIRDDGVGFDVRAAHARAMCGESLGLLGMEERALLAGGHLQIISAPTQGTKIHACFPWIAPPSPARGKRVG